MSTPIAAAAPHAGGTRAARTWRAAWSWARSRPWLLLPFLAAPALWPFFSLGLPKGSDSLMHLMRLSALDDQIRQGVLFPRWIPELMLGNGYPLFNFYGPLSYYVAEAFRLLGLSSYHAFMLSGALFVLAAGFGAYRLASDLFGEERPWAVLVAAVAYLYAPYLLTNVFIRGAVPEAGAQALLPWIFWGMRRLLLSARPGAYVLPVALSLGGLAATHNITLLFVPPALLAYVAVLWWQAGRPARRLGWAALGLAAAVGASAFFVLPLALERGYLIESPYAISRVTLPENAWRWDFFLYFGLVYGYSFAIPFRLGLVQIALATAGAVSGWFWGMPRGDRSLPRGEDVDGRRMPGAAAGLSVRPAEWLYWIGLAIVAGLGISSISLPLWLGSPLLLIAQFPWRLLSVLSLPLALLAGGVVAGIGRTRLALLAGGVVAGIGRPRLAAAVGVAAIALLIYAQAPRLGSWMSFFSPGSALVNPAVTAHLETDTRAMGASGIQEFRPRWAMEATRLAADPALAGPAATLAVDRGSPHDLEATVTTEGGPLRLQGYYFPGWQATVDGRPARAYPSTNLGLLTVDVPAGVHRVRFTWTGTAAEHAGGALALLTLAGLAWLAGRQAGRRAWALLPLALFALGAAALLWPHPPAAVASPQAAVAPSATGGALQLAGYRLEEARPSSHEAYLYVYPYWYVAQSPGDLRFVWEIQDAGGRVVGSQAVGAYFNAGRTLDWAPGTLVDDAQQIALPPGLPAGAYRLSVRLDPASPSAVTPVISNPAPSRRAGFDTRRGLVRMYPPPSREGHDGGAGSTPITWRARAAAETPAQLASRGGARAAGMETRPTTIVLGDFRLSEPVPGTWQAPQTADVRVGDAVRLAGYGAESAGKPLPFAGPQAPAVRAGDRIDYTLFWQAIAPVPHDYHGFVHLVGIDGQALLRADQLPGPLFRPPMLWTAGALQPDTYMLRVPAGAPGGLYWPSAGLYEYTRGAPMQDRLPAYDAAGQELADGVRLPPIKVVAAQPPAPAVRAAARLGDLGDLLGYDLTLPPGGLHAGQPFTITLQYRASGPGGSGRAPGYTRFLHLLGPAGQVAGADSPPAGGANPTWAWVAGETVVDRAAVSVPAGTPSGAYALTLGFYDPEAGAARLPLSDAQGHPLPNAEAPLGTIEVR